MLTSLTVTDLDSLRAELMMAFLNKEGRAEIWKYDITPRATALAVAHDDMNFDALQAAAANQGKPYALTGPGIEDHYFGTVAELAAILLWLCRDGYLSGSAVVVHETASNVREALTERPTYPFIPFA